MMSKIERGRNFTEVSRGQYTEKLSESVSWRGIIGFMINASLHVNKERFCVDISYKPYYGTKCN